MTLPIVVFIGGGAELVDETGRTVAKGRLIALGDDPGAENATVEFPVKFIGQVVGQETQS